MIAATDAFGNVDDAVHFLQRAPAFLLNDDGVAKMFVQVSNALSTEAQKRLFVDCFDRAGVSFQLIPRNPEGNFSNEVRLFLIQACKSNSKPSDVRNAISAKYYPITLENGKKRGPP